MNNLWTRFTRSSRPVRCRSHAHDPISVFQSLPLRAVFGFASLYFILFHLCHCLCFLVFLSVSLFLFNLLSHFVQLFDFSKRKIQPTTLENLQNFFSSNVASQTAVAALVGGGLVNLHLIECCLRGEKVLRKLIWLNAKIGHALKKDESEMKCCPPTATGVRWGERSKLVMGLFWEA